MKNTTDCNSISIFIHNKIMEVFSLYMPEETNSEKDLEIISISLSLSILSVIKMFELKEPEPFIDFIKLLIVKFNKELPEPTQEMQFKNGIKITDTGLN